MQCRSRLQSSSLYPCEGVSAGVSFLLYATGAEKRTSKAGLMKESSYATLMGHMPPPAPHHAVYHAVVRANFVTIRRCRA